MEWLSGENTYNLHKPFRKRFPRNPYTLTNIDDIWEMELAVLSSISKYNDKFICYLNAIDIFSRYAWNFPLKDKTGTSITTVINFYFAIENLLLFNQIEVLNLLIQLSNSTLNAR